VLRDVLNHALDVAEEVSRCAERDSLDLIDDRLTNAKILVVDEVLASGRNLKNETHIGGDR
jgi:pyrimidine operon attenuation protein/uracil phosphoribosyltransferase